MDDLLQIEHGSLYPALHRLEHRGWLSAKWASAIARVMWPAGEA
jgi:DNA-binding PadR family transcriptional regulator